MEASEIIERIDILEYISQFCELTEQADGEYWGLSPLKEEKTPSFSVNTEKQRFYDFSSGKGGNIIEFVCQYNNCSFYKAMKILMEYAKIEDDGEILKPTRLLSTTIAKRYKEHSKKEKESKAVVLPEDYMQRYDRDLEKLSLWEKEGISIDSMDKFQVRYDPISDRIVYPVRNLNGDIISVCGRTLDPDYKEKRIRKYTYFHSLGTLDTVYGLTENYDEIMKAKEIILFEGAKSVMIADTWGIRNTGAVLTSHLNPCQFKTLIQLGVRVVFALDAEVDIRKDANIMRLRPYTQVEWVCNRRNLLDEKDSPVDKGREIFLTLYKERGRLR